MFAVVPMLIAAGFSVWSGIAILGVILTILALLIVVVDSWSNRPVKRPPPRSRDDY